MEELMLLVKPQMELPEIGKIVEVESAFVDGIRKFKVKAILGLRWNKKNDLIVEIKGTYVS